MFVCYLLSMFWRGIIFVYAPIHEIFYVPLTAQELGANTKIISNLHE